MKYVERFQNIASAHHAHHTHLLLHHKYCKVISVNPALVMPRNCVNSADNFCYICSEVTFARQRKAATTIVYIVFQMQDRRPRQILDPAHILP